MHVAGDASFNGGSRDSFATRPAVETLFARAERADRGERAILELLDDSDGAVRVRSDGEITVEGFVRPGIDVASRVCRAARVGAVMLRTWTRRQRGLWSEKEREIGR